jgi:hypothetical protein
VKQRSRTEKWAYILTYRNVVCTVVTLDTVVDDDQETTGTSHVIRKKLGFPEEMLNI